MKTYPFVIMTDTAADLTMQIAEEHNIEVAAFTCAIGGTDYSQAFPDHSELYRLMRAGESAKTTQINPEGYKGLLRPFLAAGRDVLYLAISGGLSGTVNSANVAARELEEEFPDRKVIIIDSLTASIGQGMLAIKAAQLRDQGVSLEVVANRLRQNRTKVNCFVTAFSLTYLRRSGRVNLAEYAMGSILKIKPLLHFLSDGSLVPFGKVRGVLQAMTGLLDKAMPTIDPSETVYIVYTDNMDQAETLAAAAKVRARLSNPCPLQIEYIQLGAAVVAHLGPEAVGICNFGKDRAES